MNILLLTTHLNTGGISSYCLTLARGLKARGHEVYLACAGGELIATLKETGVIYIPIPIRTKAEINPKIIISLWKLRRFIRKHNIELVHANTRVTQVLASLIQKYTGVSYISTCHGFFKRRLFRRIFPCWGKKIIAISEQVKGHLISDFGIREADIRIVHNGIDLERFRRATSEERRAARENLALAEGPVIGIIARLSDVKGHLYLIEAMKEVIEKVPAAQLVIAGEGRMKPQLISLACRLKIGKNVRFVPNLADTRQVLWALDLFVLPSLKEGLGLALMEAMSVGLAVVGSDVGGIRTLIQHESSGMLVTPADSRSLAGAILALLGDKQKRELFGNQARQFIQQNFSQNRMAEETERVYAECLSVK